MGHVEVAPRLLCSAAQPAAGRAYISSMTVSKSFITWARLTFMDGVRWPDASVKSAGTIRNDLMASAWDTDWLARGDEVLDGGLDHRMARRFRQGGVARQAVALQPARQGFLVQRDQRADERPVVAHHQHLRHQGVGPDLVFQQGRDHVLAAGGDDDFLLAAGDPDEAVLIEAADVAGAEPAVHERFGREVVALVVAAHHADALGEDLAVVGNLDRVARQGLAHGADLDQLDGVLTEIGAVVSVRP